LVERTGSLAAPPKPRGGTPLCPALLPLMKQEPVRELGTEGLAAVDVALAAPPEVSREVQATGEGELGGVWAGVAGGAFKNAPSACRVLVTKYMLNFFIFLC
jgi:hypothetical protein